MHDVTRAILIIILLIVSSFLTLAGAALVTSGPPVLSTADMDAGFLWASSIMFTGAFGFLGGVIACK